MARPADPGETGRGLAADRPPRDWKVRTAALPSPACIHAVFEEWVERTPEAIAVVQDGGALTYRELNRRANQLAGFLRRRGVRPGARVAISLGRSIELVVTQLAILKAGGAFVPIDAEYPAQRVRDMLAETGAGLLLASEPGEDAAPGVETVCLTDRWPEIAQERADNPVSPVVGESPACLIYTSGSTGRAKGSTILHRGVVRLVAGQDYLPFQPGDRYLVIAAPSFDAILFEIWGALLTGGVCVIFPDRWPDFARLEAVMGEQRVTSLFLTSSFFNQIVERRPGLLASARHVMVGGEALSAAHLRRAMELLPDVTFVNGYGPTECTTFAVAYRIAAEPAWGCRSVPIGRPLNHTECRIVDADLQEVAIGEVGELLLGGVGLADGYLNRPELTAEKFIRHPESADPAARLYRTGDLCRWLPNGLIEYVGRADEQIKVRGFRIEPGEIEAAARDCPGVADAAVIARELADGRKQLVLFVVVRETGSRSTDGLLEALRVRLPEHLVPSRVETVAALPLTANGKADRRALAARLASTPTTLRGGVPATPRDSLEGRLVELWQRLLGQAGLDGNSDFFREGGDSLLALQLALEVMRECGWPVPVGVIFAYPTPARLAAQLEGIRGEPDRLTPPLQGTGEGAVFVSVPGLRGVARLSPALAEGLRGKHRYFDGLQFVATNPEGPFLERIEDIAAALLVQLRVAYPSGPLVLYGFSFGGLIAYEMARQLEAGGRGVDLVILGDSVPASARPYRSSRERTCMRVLDVFRPPWAHAPEKIGRLVRSLRSRAGRAGRPDADPILSPQVLAGMRAFEAYEPGTYAGRVALLRCQIVRFSPYRRMTGGWDYGWSRRVTGGLAIQGLKLHHDDLFGDAANAPIHELLATL